MLDDLLKKYTHAPEEFPVLAEQTHTLLRDKTRIREKININENIVHYVQDTAQLISEIDGSLKNGPAYDHIIYLDKSARPVSWLVNLFWNDFAVKGADGKPIKRPAHSYVNIDRSPWFRKVGINVSDDGRQKDNGELATYNDFVQNADKLTDRHFAELRALYIKDGIDSEDLDWVLSQPTILDDKRVLIVDEVSRTGATLNIAAYLFQHAFPKAAVVKGTYFWHPTEPILTVGSETVLTSLPVWYDPESLTGRGIGGLSDSFYRNRYNYYQTKEKEIPNLNLKKMRKHAFASSVYSAPLLNPDGTVLDLADEKKTRELCAEMQTLHRLFKAGKIFFNPPKTWDFDRIDSAISGQGVLVMPDDVTSAEAERIKKDALFYPNFIEKLYNA